MLSLLCCRGMHLSPSEFSFSLHAQKISHGLENSQTSVLCAGQQVSSVLSHKNDKVLSQCAQKVQTSCSCYQMFSLMENSSCRKQLLLSIIADRVWPHWDFQTPVKNRVSLPSLICFQYCTTPTLFLLKPKCFPSLLLFNTPRKASHLLHICILQVTASKQKGWALHVLLSTRQEKNQHIKRRSQQMTSHPKRVEISKRAMGTL